MPPKRARSDIPVWDHISKVCVDVDAVRLLPPLLSLLPTTPHAGVAGYHLAFDLACIISVGDSRCPSVSVSGYALRLISITAVHCVALRGERYRDANSVSISLTTQRHATQRTAAVMEISL